jgi:hypothetical protein
VCGSSIAAGTTVDWDRQVVRHLVAAECDAALAAAATVALTPTAPAVVLALKPIADFLSAARQRGLKFPKLRVLAPDAVSELRLSLTRSGQAPGSVTVSYQDGRCDARGQRDGWVGSVRPDGEVRGPLSRDLAMQAHLLLVATDPAKAARSYAALMSRCSFCGLPLTDEGSVEVGYGPVCAANWGLPHTPQGTRQLSVVVAA